MNAPVGDDDFFAVQVVDDLDDDRAILVVGDRKIAVELGDLVELVELVEKRKPIERRGFRSTDSSASGRTPSPPNSNNRPSASSSL